MNASFIKNGKEVNYLYQWDVDQVMKLTGFQSLASTDVHFSNNREGKAIVVSGTVDADGNLFAVVPNVLLEDHHMIYAHVYSEGGTIEEATIVVKGRAKPSEIGLKTETIELTSGITKVVQDAEYARLNNLFVYGNSSQDGTPTRENPINIDNLTSETININEKIATLSETLRSVAEIKDKIIRANDGIWKIERNVGVYSFTGDESVLVSLRYGHYRFDIITTAEMSNKNVLLGYCTHFLYDLSPIGSNEKDNTIFKYYQGSNFQLRCDALADVESLKTWFAEQNGNGTPVTVVYPLDVPKYEVLNSDIQQALNAFMMQKGINNILLTTDKDTTGKLVYFKK